MKKIIRRTMTGMATTLHEHPVLQRIYHARGVRSSTELDRGLEKLLQYHSLLGIDAAVACLVKAIAEQKRILIIGDFDADGATSSALAVRALKSFGAKFVNYLVPNRFQFGYGLTPELVQAALVFSPEIIITVDNGIASHAGVLAAKELNMQVIITDHHLPADTLPPADAIVNPNQVGDTFPSKNIAGVGVIFYVMLALRKKLTDNEWFVTQKITPPVMSRFLDLVALGTVADVVPLDHNNRILVHQGLRRIRAGHCVPGITALLEIAGRNQQRFVASDLGFAVAPRLNAAGRLDDMSLGIECLLTDDLTAARDMANTLNQLNDERRAIEQDMQEQAIIALKKFSTQNMTELPCGVCLFDEGWHQGVIGILASRMKDRLHRPVIAFALANETELKGSARSIPRIHIRDVLANIAAQFPTILQKFGGHAMAAGLTIAREHYDQFATVFDAAISQLVTEIDLNHSWLTDGELAPHELTLELSEVIREAGPWGQIFPEPLFDGVFNLIDQRIVGNKHLKMVVAKDQQVIDAIAFNVDLNHWPNHRCQQVNMVYRLDVNEFRGKKSMQLIVEMLESV